MGFWGKDAVLPLLYLSVLAFGLVSGGAYWGKAVKAPPSTQTQVQCGQGLTALLTALIICRCII